MLVLTRRRNEGIVIGGDETCPYIRIILTNIKDINNATFGIEAPRDVRIIREELINTDNVINRCYRCRKQFNWPEKELFPITYKDKNILVCKNCYQEILNEKMAIPLDCDSVLRRIVIEELEYIQNCLNDHNTRAAASEIKQHLNQVINDRKKFYYNFARTKNYYE